MNRLISGAVQLLDEAAKRKPRVKTVENYGTNRKTGRFDFDSHTDPHYQQWKRIVQDHPDFHHFEDEHYQDWRNDSRGMVDSGTGNGYSVMHAVDEIGDSIGSYKIAHPVATIDPPYKPKKKRKK